MGDTPIPFVTGVVIGALFTFCAVALVDMDEEKACEKLHNVYDCNLKPEPYEPASKGDE